MANRSFETAGLEDPARRWLDRWVRVKSQPQWGRARVIRWYPAGGAIPTDMLRVMPEKCPVAKLVSVDDVELIEPDLG